jgi:cyanophycin synthetase
VIVLDTDAKLQLELKRQDLDGHALYRGRRIVTIQRNGNMAIDCTDLVHPDVACGRAGRPRGRPGHRRRRPGGRRHLASAGGARRRDRRVNAGPGLLMHLKPPSTRAAAGGPRDLRPPFRTMRRAASVVGVAGSRTRPCCRALVAG